MMDELCQAYKWNLNEGRRVLVLGEERVSIRGGKG